LHIFSLFTGLLLFTFMLVLKLCENSHLYLMVYCLAFMSLCRNCFIFKRATSVFEKYKIVFWKKKEFKDLKNLLFFNVIL
jgi:hypothetical protein